MKANRKQISIAMGLCLGLLLISFVVASAAPTAQTEAVRVDFFTAAIVGILYYLALSPWFANLGFTVLYRPLIAGTLVGLVMGRLGEGIAIGANINVLYLGWISAGGSLPGDPGLAGYLGTALALGGGLDVQGALAIAAPLGLLGSLTWSLRMSVCSIIPHRSDRLAEAGDVKGVARSNYIYAQPFLFVVYAVPVALAAYLGSAVVASALDWIGANAIWVMNGLFTASGMLAALGIALNLKFLLRGSVWPYFFIGFTLTALVAGGINLLVMAIIGVALAFLHVQFTEKAPDKEKVAGLQPVAVPVAAATAPNGHGNGRVLTRQDVFQSWLRWLFFSHSTYNWERLQGLGFAHSMTPVIEKLYHTKEEVSAALKRHLVFFNTQPDIGGVIHGAVIAMEEERASGAEISDDAINGVKTGLMGPMAGIGDTIQQGIVIPIVLAIGMGIATGGAVGTATTGNILGPLFVLVVLAAFIWGVGWLLWWQGYQQGRSAVTNILQGGLLNRVIVGAGVLGNFIMGALAVSFVNLSTPVVFTIGGTTFRLQEILNSFMPELLPLLLVLLIWWLVARKNVSPTKIMLAILVIGVLGSFPLLPGLDANGNAIRVGLFGG
ncbi:MAG TPA: PTS system mannose/fructose/sorbose family transporter subunit IID [Anaerolineae bacterium]|nr:PTS system mannose/fructose/sorbose family transporter subunit IID [Anaerolineae bacterium]